MPLTATISAEKDRRWRQWICKLESKLGESGMGEFKDNFPSVTWCPNIAQERIFSVYDSEPYPKIALVTFGNGTGKTDALSEFLCACAKGVEWVNPVFCQGRYFKDLQKKRESGTLTIWWVCDADLFKKQGADHKAIKAHVPDALFRGCDSKSVFHEIVVPFTKADGTEGETVIQIKTHGQSTESFAGDNVDLIICDEPPPEQHWAEIIGRTRSKKGEAGARILIGGTPLNISGYLLDLAEDPELKNTVVHLKGSTWENCADDEIPEEEARKRGMPKDENGRYITRGHLTCESIRDQIRIWAKSSDPMEMAARVDGEFGNVIGRIYKKFSRLVHVVPDFKIPSDYPVLFYVDPHDARPDVGIWVAISPRDKLIVFAESPIEPYEKIYSRGLTIGETCEDWNSREEDMGVKPLRCYGDPNKMLDPDPYTNKRLLELYAKHGRRFNTNITDSLAIGHQKVREMLDYDIDKWNAAPGEPSVQPQIIIFESCENCINFMSKYSSAVPKDMSKAFKEQTDDRYKDFPDVIRYAAVTFKPYSYWKELQSRGLVGEWTKIKNARTPVKEDTTFKGRRIVSARVFK